MLDGGKGAFKGFWRPGFSCVNFHSHRPCVCENTPTHISRNGLSTAISFTLISWQINFFDSLQVHILGLKMSSVQGPR